MRSPKLWIVILCICFTTFSLLPAGAQSTISTGSIQGTVTDPNGAVVPNATVTITSKATGQASKLTSSSSGGFASGALIPGEYEVKVEAKGFQTQVITVPVQVGNVTAANAKMAVGESSEVVEVTGSTVAVNTEQATVQGVLTTQQIENLPINGRNFLDLAQLEPGVQIQDGGNFDPTKNGFSSISFGGRFGRTARIEVDGIDISDETVGTTTQNLPASAIQEFQISQSSLDMSTELTSSGAVNVVTRSGTNKWHGEAFGLFRDHSLAAKSAPTDLYFQRSNFGGNLGGPIIKDRLFFFLDAERLKQDAAAPVINSSNVANATATAGDFSALNGSFNSPFRDTEGVAKLDWRVSDKTHVFYRFSYEQNNSTKGIIPNSFQPFTNVNNTPVHAAGIDFTTGSFTHAIRFGYTKFRNGITGSQGVFDLLPGISLSIGQDPNCLTGGFDSFCSGPNLLAPQKTFQQNTQIKYDGSKTIQTHILRFGFGYNHIQGGGFAKFFALAPVVNTDPSQLSLCATPGASNCISNAFAGGLNNPLNYPVQNVVLGNGQGFSSEKPAFGLPAGGLGPDNRIQFYAGDSWKIRPNLTLTYGLRYVRDTGRTDSDIASPPCSALDPGLAANLALAGTTCTTNILDLFGPGLGNRVRTPGHNFGPTAGLAWDPTGSGKFVIRAGAGIYYENSIFNNNLFNRPGRLAQGLFLNTGSPCKANGTVNPSFAFPGGAPIPVNLATICGQPIGSVSQQLIQLQQAFQAATLAAGPAANGAFIGNTLAAATNFDGINLFAPNYQTPRSVQMNIGFEKQLGKGVVWNVDYLRNVGTHTLLGIDVNHVGDVRFFNKANAVAAINATNASFGCADVNCAIAAGATIADYAGNGLDSGTNFCGGGPCDLTAPGAAFPGINQGLGVNQMLFSAGRSLYNAMQTSLRANVSHPFRGVKSLNWQVSYSLSRYDGSALDSDFINSAVDNNNPNASLGPNGLDRTHQLSFGGTFDLPGYIRFGVVGHVYSPLPVSLTLPGGGAGGIFISDVTGDGSGDGSGIYPLGDLVPGTKLGAYGRSIKPSDLASFISRFNATQAGNATPAGQVLINNGLMTLAQLQALGGVIPTLDAPPSVQGLDWLKTVDLKLSYPRRIREGMTLEPSVSFYNAFNQSNLDGPGNTLNGILNSGAGSVNGSTSTDHLTTRILPGSGVFDLGSPRVMEFGLKFTF
ncbi:MAG TPA: carboxypeptidase regulatory-like domain-containing protein [Candidatus Angelobacter sp.]|nr:carboxypeptidase regulatory-like domain-containing protein [Candidatus Angelobacter sp.]